MTQARLAEMAGIAEQSLSRLERGFYEPALSSAWSLAQALGVSLDRLVEGSAQPRLTASERTDVTRLSERATVLAPRIVTAISRLVAELGADDNLRHPARKATAKAAPRKATRKAAATKPAKAAKAAKATTRKRTTGR